jgi:hypothetical protein
LVIHISSFFTIKNVGFDPREGRQGDIAIGVTLSRFFIRTTIWLKISHMMIKVGSSSTQVAPSFFTSLNGLINQSEKFGKLHENLNNIPRLGDIWILINPLPLGTSIKFFKLECNNEFKEGNIIIKVELSRFVVCILS